MPPDEINTCSRTMVLLAPPDAHIPSAFRRVEENWDKHDALLSGMQRLRGRVYLDDGAIENWQLTRDGRHTSSADLKSWHLLLQEEQSITGCARYFPHDPTAPFSALTVAESALALSSEWGAKLKSAVEIEMNRAHSRRVSYVEVGGWALHEELRATTEALRIVIGTYALAAALGGCLGITTATFRNHSSSILRKVGGHSLESGGHELPPYYDPRYRCNMEILGFDSAVPNPKLAAWAERMKVEISAIPVVCRRARREERTVRAATSGRRLMARANAAVAAPARIEAPAMIEAPALVEAGYAQMAGPPGWS